MVRGGITNLSTIIASQTKVTLLPSEVSVADQWFFDEEFGDDLFIGFPDQASQILLNDGSGKFTPDFRFNLPFGPVLSGTKAYLNPFFEMDLLAQPLNQPGAATAVLMDGTSGVLSHSPFETGLSGDCEKISRSHDQGIFRI